ncbi:immunity 42 family protein [Atlantibacter hermannii]|uniref:immunity 42 family protein n=1 Tax=Atlantibacter hermannii TaxID=565 RepID=UPI0028975991|nr:immunity 42 family protein [Atlantibacter hermannii]
MIFGDPYRFAIWAEPVLQWSNSYKNGLFYLIINGRMYPDDIRTSTLSSDLIEITGDDCALVSKPVNKEIFALPTLDAFNCLLNLAYPEPSELDEYPDQVFDFCITSPNVSDFGGCFFCVADEKNIRVIGGKTEKLVRDKDNTRNVWQKIEKPVIEDVIIPKDEIEEIISAARNYSMNIT